MQDFARKAFGPGPIRHVGGVLVAGRNHHLNAVDVAGRRGQTPGAAVPVDSLNRGAEPQCDPAIAHVALQVRDDLIARRVDGGALWVGPPRKVRELSPRVETEPVVAVPPGPPDAVAPVDEQRAYTAIVEAQRGRDTCRACTDDDDL